jgi:[ribosomal protein S5]-alanine N-acetyltransferase
VRLAYPDGDLSDGVALLRKWSEADLGCVREASTDPQIPRGTTVPATFTEAEGLAFIHRQWGRLDRGEGVSLALADAATNEAVGLIVLMLHPRRPGVLAHRGRPIARPGQRRQRAWRPRRRGRR